MDLASGGPIRIPLEDRNGTLDAQANANFINNERIDLLVQGTQCKYGHQCKRPGARE